MELELLGQIWQWIAEAEAWEWVFSGVGLPIAGWLILRYRRKPPAPQDTAPPVSNTFTSSGSGDQNIAQGDHPIGKQVNLNAEEITSPQQEATGHHNVFSQTGDVRYEEHHHHYARTEQGIPLQRPRQAEHLVGREKLLKEVLAALRPGRAVTLCGPGGIDKTALASRVAWELSPDGQPPALFPDGLIFYLSRPV
ncbi:MAG: hypothetical protein ACL93V_15720 [Candidatus Electrothrix sp. YB6]